MPAPLLGVAAGHRPTISEAASRLESLRPHGSSPAAFTFGTAFAAPDAARPDALVSLNADLDQNNHPEAGQRGRYLDEWQAH
jgi:hypothetical protein